MSQIQITTNHYKNTLFTIPHIDFWTFLVYILNLQQKEDRKTFASLLKILRKRHRQHPTPLDALGGRNTTLLQKKNPFAHFVNGELRICKSITNIWKIEDTVSA